MLPGNFVLALYRGDSYEWKFTLWDDEGKTQPTDLTNAEVAAQIRDKPDGAILVTLTTVVELPNIIHMSLPATESAKFTNKKAAWDLQLRYSNGSVRTVLAGSVNITLDITKAEVVR